MSGSCVNENALLMSEVRGEWTDWLEMIERQSDQKLSDPSLLHSYASTELNEMVSICGSCGDCEHLWIGKVFIGMKRKKETG